MTLSAGSAKLKAALKQGLAVKVAVPGKGRLAASAARAGKSVAAGKTLGQRRQRDGEAAVHEAGAQVAPARPAREARREGQVHARVGRGADQQHQHHAQR